MSECYYCSFCGRSQSEADIMVATHDAVICGVCVDLCAQFIADERKRKESEKVQEGE